MNKDFSRAPGVMPDSFIVYPEEENPMLIDISNEIMAIESGVKGEDVRVAISDSVKKLKILLEAIYEKNDDKELDDLLTQAKEAYNELMEDNFAIMETIKILKNLYSSYVDLHFPIEDVNGSTQLTDENGEVVYGAVRFLVEV